MQILNDAGPGGSATPGRSDGRWIDVDGRRYLAKSLLGLAAKRAFDIVVSGIGLIVALPLFAIIAVLIRIDSPGPVFYRQTRVGRRHRDFKMLKFRKMYENLPSQGPSLTMRYDFRMTRFGRVLERTKLDELPQLVNVLRGDMSVIGPRPEVPKFVAHYPERWNEVLSVKPGVFGPNQIRNRNESELYPPGCEDVEAFYIKRILPDKLDIDGRYAREAGVLGDLLLLVQCLFVALAGTITVKTWVTMRQQVFNFLVLSIAGVGGMMASFALAGHHLSSPLAVHGILLAAIIKPMMILFLHVPKSLAVSVTPDDFFRRVWCAAGCAALILLGLSLLGHRDLDALIVTLDTALFLGVLFVHKLVTYAAFVTFRVQATRALRRRMVWASLILGPLSLIVAAVLLRRPHGWVPGAPFLAILFLAAFVRPAVMLLLPAPARRGSPAANAFSEGTHLMVATLVGSAALILGASLLGRPSIVIGEAGLDAIVFFAMISTYALWQAVRLRVPDAGEDGQPRGRQRLLIAGSGIELSAFVAAMAALPEHEYEIVGILTPHEHQRTSTVGGYPVLGEFVNLTEILKTLRIDKLIVLPTGISKTSLAFLQNTAEALECRYQLVPLLSGILSFGGTKPPREAAAMPSRPQLVTAQVPSRPVASP